MSSSPWNKRRFLPGKKKKMLAPVMSSGSLANCTEPVELQLGNTTLRFDNGEWYGGEGGPGNFFDEDVEALKQENDELRERNNMLEFKVQLLLDMMTAQSLDLDRCLSERR
jgi:Chibby family